MPLGGVSFYWLALPGLDVMVSALSYSFLFCHILVNCLIEARYFLMRTELECIQRGGKVGSN